MHSNYYFLRQLAPALEKKLAGRYLREVFSQEKDEIILVWDIKKEDDWEDPFVMRVPLKPEFACFNFPERFDRARKNSVNLFPELIGLKLLEINALENERALALGFDNGLALVFKLFGNRSNCLLFNTDGVVANLFHKRLKSDWTLRLSDLQRPIKQDYDAFIDANYRWELLFPTFGKIVNNYLKKRLVDVSDPQMVWNEIEAVVRQLEKGEFYLTVIDHKLHLSLIKIAEADELWNDPIKAVNAFYIGSSKVNYLEKEKNDAIRLIQKRIEKTQSYLEHSYKRLELLLNGSRNEEIGNILMANLHQIQEHHNEVTLYDFYNEKDLTIQMKKGTSPQKLAESYYRKGKNEQIEIKNIEENIERRENELRLNQGYLLEIEEFDKVKDLRDFLKLNGVLKTSKNADPIELFNMLELQGFTILIGKNAKNNDILTKQYAKKDDLWLHARDVSGSHVVIKHQTGKKIPNNVIERAAELAAWYSKRRNDSLCPVIVTPKKYVRKTKGLPDGAVIIDREQVIMVKPTQP